MRTASIALPFAIVALLLALVSVARPALAVEPAPLDARTPAAACARTAAR